MASPLGRKFVAGTQQGFGRASVSAWFLPLLALVLVLVLPALSARGQDDPLNQVHITAPAVPATTAKADSSIPLTPNASLRTGIQFRIDTNLVLVPLTVTDPMDRLVTGLEKQNFSVFEDNH